MDSQELQVVRLCRTQLTTNALSRCLLTTEEAHGLQYLPVSLLNFSMAYIFLFSGKSLLKKYIVFHLLQNLGHIRIAFSVNKGAKI